MDQPRRFVRKEKIALSAPTKDPTTMPQSLKAQSAILIKSLWRPYIGYEKCLYYDIKTSIDQVKQNDCQSIFDGSDTQLKVLNKGYQYPCHNF